MKTMIFILLFSILSTQSYANEEEIKKIKESLVKLDVRYSDSTVLSTSSPFFYLVSNKGDRFYITSDSKHFIFGDVFKNIENRILINLEDEVANNHRKEIISKINYNDLVKFGNNENPKMELIVFTDITCPYCKKMHEDLDTILKANINIYYLPYSRRGLNHEPTVKMLSKIMCSEDPAKSFHEGFSNPNKFYSESGGIKKEDIDCGYESKLLENQKLGDLLGVGGTPAIFFKNGAKVEGYLSLRSFIKDISVEFKQLKMEKLGGKN